MRPRFSFPQDLLLQNADELTLRLVKHKDGLILSFKVKGGIGSFFDDDEPDDALAEPKPDPVAAAVELIGALQRTLAKGGES